MKNQDQRFASWFLFLLLKENKVRFIGRGQLGKRPLDTYYEIFERQNIGYLYRENVLDLNVVGRIKT